ncbi:MAG: hypothetical protein AVDCRST_MAG70-635, partial [uncultured Thermomicrobiales bacterium]
WSGQIAHGWVRVRHRISIVWTPRNRTTPSLSCAGNPDSICPPVPLVPS